jgi:hypothetical protein
MVHVVVESEQIAPKVKSAVIARRDSLNNEANTPTAVTNNVNLYNSEIQSLKEENAKKEKIIKELNSKITADETTLRLREQEKLSLLTELDLKTKQYQERETNYNLFQSEYSQLQKTYKQLRETQFELSERNKVLEQKNTDLTNRLNQMDQERQLEMMNYEKKLRITELKIVEKDEGKGLDTDQILNLTRGYVSELVDLVRTKMSKLEERMVSQEKIEGDYRSSLIETIDRRINDLVTNLKENQEKILTEEKNFFKKQLYEAENKNVNASKTTEWYKSQIAELYPFKSKYNSEKYEIEKLKKEKETLQNIKNVLDEKNTYLDNYVKNLSDSLMNVTESKERYKNAFLESEKLFNKYVKDKKLRDLINFNISD